jgi:hypothetical protein
MHFYNEKMCTYFLIMCNFSKKCTIFQKMHIFCSRVDEAYKDELKLIWNFFMLSLYQGCTTRISWWAKKMLLTHLRARLVKFFSILQNIYIKNQTKYT